MKGQAIGSGGQLRSVLLIVVVLLLVTRVGNVEAQEGSPAPSPDGASGLTEMLAHVPADLPELESPEQAIVAYADIAAQLKAVGVEAPESVDDEGFGRWQRATAGLAMPSRASEFISLFRADFGFDLLQTERTLAIEVPPFNLAFFRGNFDEATVLAALEDLGYRPGGIGGQRVLSVGEDAELDLTAPGSYALGSMDYMTILDDGTLVFASERAIIAAVIAVDTGDAPSLIEQRGVAALVEQAPADLVSAAIVPGTQLLGGPPLDVFLPQAGATPDMDAVATEMAEQAQMPRVTLALLAETAGGPLPAPREGTPVPLPDDAPTGRGIVILLMPGPAAAENAVPVIEERLMTGTTLSNQQPFAELFPDPTVTALPDDAVVVVELPFGEAYRGILLRLLYSRDLGFVAWG